MIKILSHRPGAVTLVTFDELSFRGVGPEMASFCENVVCPNHALPAGSGTLCKGNEFACLCYLFGHSRACPHWVSAERHATLFIVFELLG